MNAMLPRVPAGVKALALALAIGAATYAPASAQATQDSMVTTTTTETEERGGGFPWGLLGLLGLAGLLGRGKKEVHHETVRPVETHRATTHTTANPVTDRTVIRPDETGGTHGGTTGGGTRL